MPTSTVKVIAYNSGAIKVNVIGSAYIGIKEQVDQNRGSMIIILCLFIICSIIEDIEEITLKLKHEKDGKEVGEVMVGINGLRFGRNSNSPQADQQHNEPATGNLLNLDNDTSTGPSVSTLPDSTSGGSGSSPTPAASNSGGSRTSQQQQTTNRTSLLGATAAAAGVVATGRAVSTAGAVTSGSSSTLPSTGPYYYIFLNIQLLSCLLCTPYCCYLVYCS